MEAQISHELLTTDQAARALACSAIYLAVLRTKGGGPTFLKIGRNVRYRRSDLEAWLNSRARTSTSEAAHG